MTQLTKFCNICQNEKPIQEFYKDKTSNDGYRSKCKICDKLTMKKWRTNNREKHKASSQSYRESNKEKCKEAKKVYYEANKEKCKTRMKSYYDLNKEKCKSNMKDYMKNRLQIDPLFKYIHNIRSLIIWAFKNGGYSKTSHTYEILGCDFKVAWNYLIKKAKERYIDFKEEDFLESGKYHLDHIIPISTAKNESEVIKLNHYTNFQILLAKENIAKRNILDWVGSK